MYLQRLDNRTWHYIMEVFVGESENLYYGFAQTSNGYYAITKGFKAERTAARKVKELLSGNMLKEVVM